MKEYKAENGQDLNDKTLDEMAKKYEDGSWGGRMGKLVVGRPSLSDEDRAKESARAYELTKQWADLSKCAKEPAFPM